MLINYMYSHCGESCCLISPMCTDGSAVTSTAVSLCCKHPNVTQTVVWVNLSSLEWKKSVSAHIFILFIFRKGWLDWAKTDFEITAGPYRAGRAVFQLWGYHYSVAGCQGKVPLQWCFPHVLWLRGTAVTGCDKAQSLPTWPYMDGFWTSRAS